MSLRKILGRTGLVLAALVAILLVTRAVLNYSTGRKLEKFLAAAKSKGLPVSYTDLGPACPVPDNAWPLWKAAVALFDGRYKAKPPLNQELTKLFEGQAIDEKSRSIIRTGIEMNRRPIDLLLEAAGRPCFRTDRPVFSDQSFSQDYISTLHLIRLLGFEALFRAESGDVAGSLREWNQGFRFVRTMHEPVLIAALIEISNARSLLAFLNRIVDGRAVDVDDLKTVLKELDVEAWRTGVAGSWKGERAFRIETGRDILSGRLDAYESEIGSEIGRGKRFLLWLVRPWIRIQLMRQYSAFDQIETLFGEPYYQSRPRMNAYDDRHLHWYEWMPDGAITNISSTGLKEASLEALMESARIGIAARIYRMREKRFPAAVSDLVPSLLPREPLDPFTGKPFVYRIDKDGLLVYSLGSNEKDNGGRGAYSIEQLVTPKDDDWAWRDTIRSEK